MDLTLSNIIDLIEGIGVIGSLIFVGFQIRANTKQNQLKNWEAMIDRFMNHHATLMDYKNSETISKGRKNFNSLSDQEKIIFDAYHYNTILAYEVIVVTAINQVHKEKLLDMPRIHLKDIFSYPGAKEWYLQKDRPHAPLMQNFMDSLIQKLN